MQSSPQFWLMGVLALLCFFIVLVIRAFPWNPGFATKKPLSCDACMSFWVSLTLWFACSWFFGISLSWALLHVLPVPGLAVFLLRLHARLTDFIPPG